MGLKGLKKEGERTAILSITKTQKGNFPFKRAHNRFMYLLCSSWSGLYNDMQADSYKKDQKTIRDKRFVPFSNSTLNIK